MKKILSIAMVVMILAVPSTTLLADEVNDYLEDILVMDGATEIDIEFDAEEHEYEIEVPYATSMLSVEPILNEDWDLELDNITIEVTVEEEAPVELLDGENIEVELEVGTTEVTITITDDEVPIDSLGDEDIIQTYILHMTRTGILDELEVLVNDEAVDLTPEFDKNEMSYFVIIDDSTTSAAITYELAELPEGIIAKVEMTYLEEPTEEVLEGEWFEIDMFGFGGNLVAIDVSVAEEGDTPEFESVANYEVNFVSGLAVLYDKSDDPEEEEWEEADIMALVDTLGAEYEAVVHPWAEEVRFEFDLEPEEGQVIKVDGELYSVETLYEVEQGTTTFIIELFEDELSVDVLWTYTVHVKRPVPLLDLEIDPIETFEFDPLDRNYNLKVASELESVELIPSAPEDVAILVNGEDVEATPELLVQDLEEGQNHILIATEYDGAVFEYRIKIFRGLDKTTNRDPKERRYRYEFGELLGDGEENGELYFGEGAYEEVVNAFKYGSNKDNEIYVSIEGSIDGATLTIDYDIYKYLVQHKVVIIIMDEEDHSYELSIKDLRLNKYIKGPNDVELVIISFEVDGENIEVEVALDDMEIESGIEEALEIESDDEEELEDKANGKSNKDDKTNKGKGKSDK